MEKTPVFLWYDRYGAEIRKLFSSSITIKILLAMNGQPATKAELCDLTGYTPSALQARIRHLEEAGLVRGSGNSYALTAAGSLLVQKIVSQIARLSGTPADDRMAAGGDTVPDTMLPIFAFYEEHMNEINMVLRSSVLTHLLLLLGEEPMTRDRLRKITGCSSPNFRAYIKKLLDAGLVREEGHLFSLTPWGSGIARGMGEFFLTYAVVAEHRAFWEEHSLDGLPPFALESIADLIGAECIKNTQVDFAYTYSSYLEVLARANHIHGVTNLANPGVADAIGKKVMAGVPAELVVSPDLAAHLHEEPYAERVSSLAVYPHMQFYVTTLPITFGLTITDKHLSMKLYLTDGVTYDIQSGLVSTSPASLAWGERLFQHYKRHAVPIEEFMQSAPMKRS
jgi:predicted transcriptional regulator